MGMWHVYIPFKYLALAEDIHVSLMRRVFNMIIIICSIAGATSHMPSIEHAS